MPTLTTQTPRKRRSPYQRFLAATLAETRAQPRPDSAQQAAARVLVAKGWVAYENAEGQIRDVGLPRGAGYAGQIFKARTA